LLDGGRVERRRRRLAHEVFVKMLSRVRKDGLPMEGEGKKLGAVKEGAMKRKERLAEKKAEGGEGWYPCFVLLVSCCLRF